MSAVPPPPDEVWGAIPPSSEDVWAPVEPPPAGPAPVPSAPSPSPWSAEPPSPFAAAPVPPPAPQFGSPHFPSGPPPPFGSASVPPAAPQFGSPHFPPQPAPSSADRPAWRNARVAVLVVALVAVIAGLGITAVLTTKDEPSAALTEGTCFDAISPEHTGPAVFLRAEDNRVVSCDEPHLAEVIATYELEPDASGDAPSLEELPEGYELPCVVDASARVLGDEAADLSVSPLLPTPEGWAAGHHDVLCAVTSGPGPDVVALPPGSYVRDAAISPPTTEPSPVTTAPPDTHCFDADRRRVDCDEPHLGEDIVVVSIERGHTSDQEVFYECVAAVQERQYLRPIDDLEIHGDLDGPPTDDVTYAVCSVQVPAGESPLVGSLLVP